MNSPVVIEMQLSICLGYGEQSWQAVVQIENQQHRFYNPESLLAFLDALEKTHIGKGIR